MKTIAADTVTVPEDSDLVADCLAGHRDAFGQIVARYQTLICSLAFSATGNLSQSEDVAQETFLTAWRQLRALRDPVRLRAWLCQIARNRILDLRRRQNREPVHAAEPLNAIHDCPALAPLPVEQAISQEEEGILWRSLERIPETYREPLILYYREHQSVARVAAALEMSEDAVKQRLSRGRRLLQAQVAAFVGRVLERTKPGGAFKMSVLAALPWLPAPAEAAALGATAAKSGAVAKATAAAVAWGSFFWGAVVGVLGAGYIGSKTQVEDAKSPRERQFRIQWAWTGVVLALLVLGLVHVVKESEVSRHALVQDWAPAALAVGFAILSFAQRNYFNGRIRQIQTEDGTRSQPEKLARASKIGLCLGLAKRMAGLMAAVLVLTVQSALEHRWTAAGVGLALIPLFVLLAVFRWHRQQKGAKATASTFPC
jgi:RNA polymerase sigma factor (sigma-70 family)